MDSVKKSVVGTAIPATEKENNVNSIIEYSIAYNKAYCNKQKCPTYMSFADVTAEQKSRLITKSKKPLRLLRQDLRFVNTRRLLHLAVGKTVQSFGT